MTKQLTRHRWFFILLVLFSMGSLYWIVRDLGVTELLADIDQLITRIRLSGAAGPFLIIGFMALAIVFNPLPSAPIALAAGAIYGHTWGTLYIICGALLGAITAFLIARLTGQQFVHQLTRRSGLSLGRYGSQNALTGYVFVSRLIPFISFDLVSYAAGLTTITLWRFSLATLFGLIPASFLLAHFGGEMVDADLSDTAWLLLLAGFITLPALLLKLYQHYRKGRLEVQKQ